MEKLYAFCYRDGIIEFAGKAMIPEGCIVFASDTDEAKLRDAVSVKARHGKGDGAGLLLVPGVPEADTDDDAIEAFLKWKQWAFPQNRIEMLLHPAQPVDSYCPQEMSAEETAGA